MDAKTSIRTSPPTVEDIINRFSYHTPTTDQLIRMAHIRQTALNFALAVFDKAPASADRTAAIRKIHEAQMTANAAIMLEGKQG